MIEWSALSSSLDGKAVYSGRRGGVLITIMAVLTSKYQLYYTTIEYLMAGDAHYRLIGEFSELEQAKAAAELLI